MKFLITKNIKSFTASKLIINKSTFVTKRVYIGNVNSLATENDLREFIQEDYVKSYKIIKKELPNVTKAVGFVDMDESNVDSFIEKYDSAVFMNMPVVVRRSLSLSRSNNKLEFEEQ